MSLLRPIRRGVSCAAAATLLCALPAASVAAQGAAPKPLGKWERVAHDLFKELIEINTQASNGSTLLAAQAMAARLKAAGFPDSDVVVVQNAPKKGNLVARLHGRNTGKKPILLLAHLDVVEAKPEDWTLPPYTFTEKDGTFFGRGIADDKDDAAIDLTMLMRFREEKFVPDRDIIVALTTDEEGGPDNGVDYLLKNRPELIQAEYALNEGGGGSLRGARKLSNDVQASEKRVTNFRLEATNEGGHSSIPIKDNAITQLADALVKLGAFDFPVQLNDITRAYFERSADIAGGEMGSAMRTIAKNPTDAAAIATLSSDRRYNSQLRTTCVATMLDGGHAENALPQRARATVNCRILPEMPNDVVIATLTRVIANPKVTISVLRAAEGSPPSPMTPELLGAIEKTTKEMWPGIPVIPTMSTGATDGRFLRSLGTPVYGVSGQFYGESNAHGMNERIPQPAFYESLDFMTRLVKTLSKNTSAM
jgi:acetylornithine deacetylase/succinyl-diaminopimelate desuccinylase-like protein